MMKSTYLNEFVSNKTVYLPVGTFEWHGNHLPLETDIAVAEKFCKKLSEEIPGYIMPGIWLATDNAQDNLIGMERYLGKSLEGGIYYLNPELFYEVLNNVIKNLTKNEFKKIIILSGHGGNKQIETLQRIESDNKNVIFVTPYMFLNNIKIEHADEYETSMLWACNPEQESISRSKKIDANDDYFSWLGYDPRSKASLELGNQLLNEMLKGLKNYIKERIR